MARSEYWSGPLRLPTPAAAHVAIASGVSQRVTSPRRTRARSYSAQFPTRYVVVYVGCTLDFTSRSLPAGGRDGQHAGHCSPTALNQRTNATLRLLFHLPLRQTAGFLTSLFVLMGLDLRSPESHDAVPSWPTPRPKASGRSTARRPSSPHRQHWPVDCRRG